MKLSRVVAVGLAATALLAAASRDALGQGTPKLSKSQRALLEAVVAAVDRAAADADTATRAAWQSHVMRASNGAHYVALSALAPDVAVPTEGVMLYVRLATRPASGTTITAERSAVMEWLKGLRSDPLPMRAARSVSVPQGEMPVGGAAALTGRPGSANAAAADASTALRLQELERERAARERAEREKQRKAELESTRRLPSAMHPFEDFDAQARLRPGVGGAIIERGITAGPGEYDLFVAWAEPAPGTRAPAVRVLAHRLSLPGASATDFILSDIVLADAANALLVPYPVDQQGAHPYAIGALEAVPARDHIFRVDEALSVVFQMVNPAGRASGIPDVEVSFRVTRLVGAREELVGALPVQRYNDSNLPGDFDVAKGHPLFAAVQAPLRTFARGHYRMAITALDHVSGRRADGDVRFEVAGTPESLLREAPTPGQPFRRDAVLTPAILAAICRALTPPAPSPALTQALAYASAGRFADLVRADLADAPERPTGLALRGVGLYGLGDSPRAIAAQMQRAAAQGAPAAPVQLILGATYALTGDDRSALTAWNLAREGGIDDAAVATLVVDAYMRQGDVARAAAMARAALDSQPDNAAAARGLASTFIATARYAEALALLDTRPVTATPDGDTEFLVLHALYAGHVSNHAPGNSPAGRERFSAAARAYVEAGHRHAALVSEWLEIIAAAPPARQ